MERESFVFYGSFYESLSNLDDETRLICYDAVTQYALKGTEPKLEGVAKSIFALIKPQIDANNYRYINGCKGGAPAGNQNARKQPKTTEKQPKNKLKQPNENENENVNENVNVNVNENDNENENVNENENEKNKSGGKPHRIFVPPTVEQVKAYCLERNNSVDAQAFVDFYSSKGWMIGKNKMRDWTAAVRTWERNRAAPDKRGKVDDDFFKRRMGL